MNKFIGIAALVFVGRLCVAESDLNPCEMIPKEEMAKIIGEIKEGPKAKEGLMKEKACEWTNMSGSWLSVGISSAENWDIKKGSANNPTDLKGFGEEAFTDKRGTDAELYVRKGKWMLEVRTSSGSANAQKVAQYVLGRIP